MQRLLNFRAKHFFGRGPEMLQSNIKCAALAACHVNGKSLLSETKVRMVIPRCLPKQTRAEAICNLQFGILPTLNQARLFHTTPVRFSGRPLDDDNPKIEDGEKRPAFLVMNMFFFMLLMMLIRRRPEKQVEVAWQDFLHEMLAKGEVKEIKINLIQEEARDIAYIKLYTGAHYKGKWVHPRTVFYMKAGDKLEEKIRKAEQEMGIKAHDAVSVVYKQKTPIHDVVHLIFVGTLAVGLLMLLRDVGRNMPTFNILEVLTGNVTRAKYTRGDFSSSKVTFKDVAGLQEPKVEVMEFVEYLKNPERFKKLGAKVPKGALLLGPPGCGKTLLAKAVATEAGVPFLTMAGSQFVEMIGGLGASRMRDLFKDARKKAPCIIYIDEIDAIGKQRSGMDSEEEHTLNQLLVELDGMRSIEGVLMLASTNRHEVLDKALLRSGRFDRHITIDLPTLSERKEIYHMYLKQLKTSQDASTYVDRLAQLSPGMSGADIKNICNEAALYAARTGQTSVDHHDFDYAMERVLAGVVKRSRVLSAAEMRVVAYHEAGHALVGWLLEHTDALLKVSIVSRTNAALGFAQYSPSAQHLVSKEELFDQMCLGLGGRVAEAITFNNTTSGAQNDLQKVTQMAYTQIRNLGMNERVGTVSFDVDAENESGIKPYSKRLQRIMDEEASLLVSRAYQTTEALLVKNKDKLKLVAENLLEKQVLNYDDMVELLGAPPYGGRKNITSAWTAAPDNKPQEATTT